MLTKDFNLNVRPCDLVTVIIDLLRERTVILLSSRLVTIL